MILDTAFSTEIVQCEVLIHLINAHCPCLKQWHLVLTLHVNLSCSLLKQTSILCHSMGESPECRKSCKSDNADTELLQSGQKKQKTEWVLASWVSCYLSCGPSTLVAKSPVFECLGNLSLYLHVPFIK